MKRFFLIAAAAVLSLAMLAGCAKNAPADPDATQETVSADLNSEETWNAVVATCGDHVMTNTDLSYYYWSGYAAFLNYYDVNVQNVLDLYTPLGEQMYNDTMTWEDFFVDNAITAFRQYSAISDLAAEKNFTLSESNQTMLDNLEEELTKSAEEMGFTTAAEYLQTNYGPGASVETYAAYMRTYMTVLEYMTQAQSEITFTDDEIVANFEKNKDAYAEVGVEQDDRNMVSLRYLSLFEYDQEWEDSNGNVITTAQEIFDTMLDEWEAAEDHSEEAFMALGEKWVNYGVQQNFIEQMSPGGGNEQEIEAWSFDEHRQPGDYYALASDAGYFMLYFVGTCDHPFWFEQSRYDMQYEAFSAVIDERINSMSFETHLEQVVISEIADMYAAD